MFFGQFWTMNLVTGATGLVGARVAFDLLKSGQKVKALRRSEKGFSALSYWLRNDPELMNNLEWVKGDLLDIESLETAASGANRVFHCAALISSDHSEKEKMHKVNTQGTANLVNVCLTTPSVSFFAHVSSVAALGRVKNETVYDENSHWQAGSHNSAYAVSKYGAEREVWRSIAEGLPAVIVNPSVIIGPGNWNQGSCKLFPLIAKGFPFYSEGSTGYIDVRDVSEILIKLADKKISGERFILNSGNVSYKNLFTWMAEDLNAKKPSFNVTPWISEIAWRIFYLKKLFTGKASLISKSYARNSQRIMNYNSEKIRKLLGYEFIPVRESVRFTAEAYLNRHDLRESTLSLTSEL